MIALGHDRFILTPISSILAETVTVCNGIGFGMETFPFARSYYRPRHYE